MTHVYGPVKATCTCTPDNVLREWARRQRVRAVIARVAWIAGVVISAPLAVILAPFAAALIALTPSHDS